MRIPFSWACVLLLPVLARADEPAYTIKIKTHPDEGKSILCREVEKQTDLVRFLDADGKTVKENRPSLENEEVFTLTVLESGAKFPRRYRQTFDKAVSSTLENKNRSYQGLSIEYSMLGTKYRLELPEKHEISQSDQQALVTRANHEVESSMDEIFLPSKPVKVGDAWKIEPALLLRGFSLFGKLDPERTEGTANLVKVYDKDGTRFGVIEVDLTMAYVAMDKLQFDPPGQLRIKATLDTDITGGSNVGVLTMTRRFKGRAKFEQDNIKLTMEILREASTRQERRLPK